MHSFVATDSLQRWWQTEFDFCFNVDLRRCVLWTSDTLSPATDTRRALNWEPHHAKLVLESPHGFHSVLLGNELGTKC
jgi:hypothetical protein